MVNFFFILGFIGAILVAVSIAGYRYYSGKSNEEALEAESRPSLSRLFINLPTTKEVGVWIENHGKGVATLTPYDIVINDDKSKHSIKTLDNWKTVLTRLGINHPWVSMAAIRKGNLAERSIKNLLKLLTE